MNSSVTGPMLEKQPTSSIPKKLMDLRENKEVDSDTEERQQLAQDRMRLKKSISAQGNYMLQKVGGQTMQQAANATNGSKASEHAKEESRGMKPAFSLKKFKADNLSASNPIIGAPLGDQSMSQKAFSKYASAKLSKPALSKVKTLKKSIKFARDADESGINDL